MEKLAAKKRRIHSPCSQQEIKGMGYSKEARLDTGDKDLSQ